MTYFIGIDMGTTSTKAVAFVESGDVLLRQSNGYPIEHTHDDWNEQDPDLIFEAVVKGINQLQTALAGKGTLQGISFSAAMHGVIAVDADYKPLTLCIIWADNRAADIADNLRKHWKKKGKKIFEKTGTPLHPMSPLMKIIWLRENAPEIFKKTAKFIGIKEYVFQKLLGECVVDEQIASATGLLNIKARQWDKSALKLAGISKKKLSPVVPSVYHKLFKKINYSGTTPIDIPEGTPLVVGGSDGALANLGSGAHQSGDVVVSVGTSSAIRMLTDSPYFDGAMRTFCYIVDDNRYIVGGGTNSGAFVLQWLKESILLNTQSFDDFYNAASLIPAGSDGLFFLPYILGERAPIWNAHARGIFFGLDTTHTQAHMIRAAMEGIVFHLFTIGKVLNKEEKIKKIYAGGGFAKNGTWVQMLSDVFNCEVEITETVEISAAGAVMVGRLALGLPAMSPPVIVKVYQPNTENHALYAKCVEKFEKIYFINKTLF